MLTDRVRELLADKNNDLVISHAVLWEVLNKVGRGKLLLAGTSVADTIQRIDDLGVTGRSFWLRRRSHTITAIRSTEWSSLRQWPMGFPS